MRLPALLLLAAAASRADEPPPEEACLAFAREVEEAVRSGDGTRIGALLDMGALIERASPSFANGSLGAYAAGFRLATAAGRPPSPFAAVAEAVRDGATYTFLRLAERDGRRCARFRLALPDGSLNYHDVFLAARGDGARAEDVFVFLTADSVSAPLHHAYLSGLAEDADLVEALPPAERSKVAWVPTLRAMGRAADAGDPVEVRRLFGTLPEEGRRRPAALARLLGAARGDGEAVRIAVRACRETRPDEPCLDFLAVDPLFECGLFEEAAEAVARAARGIGGDPHLDGLRARALLEAGRPGEAREAARAALAGGHATMFVHVVLLRATLGTKRFDEVPALLDTLREKHRVELGDLTKNPLFEEFVRSDAYKAWRGER